MAAFKQATLGQYPLGRWFVITPLLLSHFQEINQVSPGRKSKQNIKLVVLLLSVVAASDNEAWKTVVVKNVSEGSHGTMTGKISYPFLKTDSLALCLTPISYVFISLCNLQCCRHLGSTSFSLTAKGIMSLGRLLYASCFQHYIMDFPKGLWYQYNYSHFREDITAAESLPVFSEISHVNCIFSSGIHLSIYLSPFTLLSRTTLLKAYFKPTLNPID